MKKKTHNFYRIYHIDRSLNTD